MPLISYLCECGNTVNKFYRQPKDAMPHLTCFNCGKALKRQLSAPRSKSVISVDNGLQSRAVDVDLELVEDIKERSTKDFKGE